MYWKLKIKKNTNNPEFASVHNPALKNHTNDSIISTE